MFKASLKNDVFSYYEKIGDDIHCIDEEIPFDVPDNWSWCRLENCCSKEIKRGKSPKYSDIIQLYFYVINSKKKKH